MFKRLQAYVRKNPLQSLIVLVTVFFMAAVLGVVIVIAVLYPNLPDLDPMTSYHPKMPLRVFTADGALMAEFGEERRNLTPIKDIPLVMKQALLAVEDQHFYEHNGFYLVGNFRALLHNLSNFSGGPKQGGSTISQQLAKNFFLTNEQTYRRKLIEALLTYKIEHNLSKDQILELYMNQIYLGQRAYGFASAAQIYFGKKFQDISAAEAAMLAGLPKSPGRVNPITNYDRARSRQLLVLKQMRQMNYLTEPQYQAAQIESLHIKASSNEFDVHGEYVAELARQAVLEEFKEQSYTRGIDVYTTILKDDQNAAYRALRKGVLDYVRRHAYQGPEGFVELPDDDDKVDDVVEAALEDYPASDDIQSAVVLDASPKKVSAIASNGDEISITGSGLVFAASGLVANAPARLNIKRGSIIRVMPDAAAGNNWSIIQLPEIEAGFVSADTNTGAIHALVGGFDFKRNQFNHVTSAWRQPGSTFKPFIYSAALEKGLTPATIINDTPLSFDSTQTGGLPWDPKNSDDQYDGPISMRDALAKSKNMVSIQILEFIGVNYGQEYAMKFGFDPRKNPPYLPLALGAGAVTPLQMAAGYAAFANGGFQIKPYLIGRITEASGNLLHETALPRPGSESDRIISEGNAFMMDSMLKNVIKNGSASRALVLNRSDIAGKTGTTNNAYDAWFAGYQNRLVGVAWIGYDQPKNLGNREFGGGLALPIWINYMQTALRNQPVEDRPVPSSLTLVDGEYAYASPAVPFVASLMPEKTAPQIVNPP
ncbi:penicillin-binding protein 1A [Oxalobacteraceae bacterium GrIS 1.18]